MSVLAVETPRASRTASEKQLGYFVPAEEFEALQAELEKARAEVARLKARETRIVAELEEAYRTLIPLPPTEEELYGPVQNPNGLDAILAKLDAA